MRCGWAGDAQVDFLGAGGPHHLHDFFRSGAAHDGIVHQHHALAHQQISNRIEFHLHAETADALFGLDEGAAHIVIADQAEFEGNAAGLGITQGGAHAAVGHGHHEIRRHRMAPRQPAPHLAPGGHDAAVKHIGIGPREIDVLERAGLGLHLGSRKSGLHTRAPHDDQLARLDLPHVIRAQQIKRAGLG